jgi:hypothetical protein
MDKEYENTLYEGASFEDAVLSRDTLNFTPRLGTTVVDERRTKLEKLVDLSNLNHKKVTRLPC